MSIITIESNLIATIKGMLGNKVRGVESLPGDWDDDTLKRLLRLVPGVFVAWAGGQAQDVGGTGVQVQGRWAVYVATGHASGEAARRLGDAVQVGAYELIELLAPALHGHEVPDVGTLKLQSVENLYTGTIDRQGLAVYALTYQIGMPFEHPVDDVLLSPFTTFTAQHDIPPHNSNSEHHAWMAGNYGNSRPDAQDNVTLPQT